MMDSTAVTASALSTLGGKTAGTVTVSNAVTISGTAAEIMAALDTADTKVTASTAVVNITGAATVDQLNAITAATEGVVTGSVTDTGDNLGDLNTSSSDNITIVVSDNVTVGELETLNTKTAGTVTAVLQDTADNIVTLIGRVQVYMDLC